jgi:hypothetical protein
MPQQQGQRWVTLLMTECRRDKNKVCQRGQYNNDWALLTMSFNSISNPDYGEFEESERQEIVVVDRQVCAGQSQEVAVCRLGSSVLRREVYNIITYISSCYVIAFNVRFSVG